MSNEDIEKFEVKNENENDEARKNSGVVIEILHSNENQLKNDSSKTEHVLNINKRKRKRKKSKNKGRKRRKLDSSEAVIKNNTNSDSCEDKDNPSSQNIYDPNPVVRPKDKGSLRPIFIDGSNVAYAHGKNKFFSVRGLKICIDYFKKRGHKVRAFVPNFRARRKHCSDSRYLQKLERKNLVIFTPSLMIRNKNKVPYDDWYIVQMAAKESGIIVSRDNFQDILEIQPKFRFVIEERRLVPTFVDDTLIFPMDPLGNRVYNLENFLRH